jgi:hypothetical protein
MPGHTVKIAQVVDALIVVDEDKRGSTIPEALSLSGVSPKQWSMLECARYLKQTGYLN